jgi:hypothetical protein
LEQSSGQIRLFQSQVRDRAIRTDDYRAFAEAAQAIAMSNGRPERVNLLPMLGFEFPARSFIEVLREVRLLRDDFTIRRLLGSFYRAELQAATVGDCIFGKQPLCVSASRRLNMSLVMSKSIFYNLTKHGIKSGGSSFFWSLDMLNFFLNRRPVA